MSVFQVGDKVTCIPFKHKGKVATVRYFGPVGRKFGTWVGLELDEPTGECSGDFNGEYLFECRENYGLVLRNTQVKLFDPNEVSARSVIGPSAGSKLTLDENLQGNDSPLVSPSGQTHPIKIQMTSQAEEESKAGEDSKKGWRDKLEKLRVKKLEEKTKPSLIEDLNTEKIRSSFAPTSGITRNDAGQLEVKQSEVSSRTMIEVSLEESKQINSQGKSTNSLQALSKMNRPTLDMNVVEAGDGKESAKDKLEKNRLIAQEKKKELQAKQDALQAQRNMRQSAVTTPRGSTSKIGFGGPSATPTPTQRGSTSNLKGAATKPPGTGIAKVNAYQSNASAETDLKRPAMTQPTVDPASKRAPSASRLAGSKRETSNTRSSAIPSKQAEAEANKKVPAGKVAPSVAGKTPMKQQIGVSLNKSLLPAQPKADIAQTFSKAEITRLETQLKEKEEEVVTLSKELESHKNKIGALMIKHNGEIKRQTEEISLLKKQVESKQSAQTDSDENQAQLIAQQALLDSSKEAERQAQDKINELEEQISTIKKQLSDMKKEVSQAKTNAALKQEEYENEIQRLQEQSAYQGKQAHESVTKELQAELQIKLDQTKKEMAEQQSKTNKELIEAQRQITKLKDDLKDEQERREEEVEILKLEKDQLIDEKAEILQKFMESAEVEEVDPLKDLGIEEIKLQNKKLRQAITTLTFGFEEERKRLEIKMNQETQKDRIIAEQDARLKHMDLLLDEVEQKELERAEMEEKLEEVMQYELMVEEMVQEIAMKEGEIDDMQERMIDIEEEHAMFEELVDNLETYNKELQDDLAVKDKEIASLGAEREQLEVIVIDQDAITQKYKSRQSQLSKQISILTEQLQYTVSSTGNKDQVSVLLEKQQILIGKLRDAAKQSLEITKERITASQQKQRSYVVEQLLPEALAEEAHLPSLEKIQMLNVTKHKATLLVRQICENYLQNAKNVYDDEDQLNQYINILLKICLLCHRIIECSSTVQFQVANMTPGQYEEITKLLVWSQVKAASTELDGVLELLMDEALGQNFEASSLEQAIVQLENLQQRTEKMFVTTSPEELKQQELSGKQEHNVSIEQQKRQNLARQCQKLKYRTSALKVAFSIVFIPHLQEKFESNQEQQQVQTKVHLIYTRLMQTILKIDMIDNRETGEEYFQESLNSDLRLQQKYETYKLMWDGSPAQNSDAKKKNWVSMIEAVERDITQLTNDYKFKKLTTLVDDKYGDRKLELNDLFSVDFEANGPWRIIANSIRQDLQDMGALKQKNTNLIEQHKQATFQVLQFRKGKEESDKVISTLENKLGQALAKAEQLNALEIERDEQSKQISIMQKKLDFEQKDNQAGKEALEESKKKLEDAKKAIAERPAQIDAKQEPPSSTKGGANIRQRQNTMKDKQGKSTMARDFFTGLQNSNFRDIRDGMSQNSRGSVSGAGNPAQILQSAQASEDMFINIINDLQTDRMRLRGKDMMVRLNNLQNEESAFSKLIKQNNSNIKLISKVPTVKINSEEQAKIETALQSVDTLKSNFKRKMASAKIIDLTKIQEASGRTEEPLKNVEIEKAVEQHQKRNTESFNYLVVEARNKMNDALEFLFQKDSKLRKLKASTAQTAVSYQKKIGVEENQQISSDQKIGEIKIGSLKLRGKIQIPSRKVILDEASLAELRSNLTLMTI